MDDSYTYVSKFGLEIGFLKNFGDSYLQSLKNIFGISTNTNGQYCVVSAECYNST